MQTGSPTNITYGTGVLGNDLGWNATGQIENLTLNVAPVGPFMIFGAQSGVGFGTATPASNATIPWNSTSELDFFLTATGGPAALQGASGCATATSTGTFGAPVTCSVASNSPFALTYNGVFTTIALGTSGVIADPVLGGNSNWAGGFTTQVNLTPSQIYATICGAGSTNSNCVASGTVNNTYSATFNLAASTPEPGTTAMLAIGGILLAFSGKKRFFARKS